MDIDINKLHLASPIPGHGGTYFSKLLFGSNDDPFYIQTPRCKTKQGIIKTGSGKKRYADLLFSTHNDNFISLINSLEESLQQMIFSKQKHAGFFLRILGIQAFPNDPVPPVIAITLFLNIFKNTHKFYLIIF